jgi:GTPase SAR1 family protein
MGNCTGGAQVSVEEKQRSKDIDLALKKDRKYIDHEIKILLLGAGESGKSTIVKQMRILFDQGFSEDDRQTFKEIISSNVILSMRSLVMGLQEMAVEFSSENASTAELFTSNATLFEQAVTKEIGSAVAKLWSDSFIKESFKEHHLSFQIPDSAAYFFDNIDRIMDPNYKPTDTDILHCRARTTGIQEVTFHVEDAHFRMVDVGGQRSERRKWIHCFQNVTGLIFFVALSEFDQKLYEDETVNRMHESIMLFAEICNCQWFKDAALILFLNKSDLFREKITNTDLNVCFPDYDGGCDYDSAIKYIRKKFVSLNQNASKKIFVHVTCATDTKMVQKVFEVVRDTLREHALDEVFGLQDLQ